MEETLGKRIASHRKGLSLTQDQLAEKLGVTAQAVSKWENDQSCPDIATLPRLAAIFDITTDELLGIPPRQPQEVAILSPEQDPHRPAFEFQFGDKDKEKDSGGSFELQFNTGRCGNIAMALWVLLTAGLLFFSYLRCDNFYSLWDCLWPTGLLVFGLFGLYPKFSFLRLGCALFGGYYIVNMLFGVLLRLNKGLALPLLLLFFGLAILTEALRKKGPSRVSVNEPHIEPNMVNKMDIDGETFHCSTSFGEDDHCPVMPRLSGGTAEVSFGDLTVDLSGCEAIAPNCPLDLKCSFGELTMLVPRGCKVVHTVKNAFGGLDIKGSPEPNAHTTLHLNCDVSFGAITIRYL